MTEANIVDSESNDNSEISSQLTEIKENYERKINELQSDFSQLKDLMMGIMSKTNDDSPTSSSQGTSKHLRSKVDKTLVGMLAQVVSLPISISFYCLLGRPTFQIPFNARPT